MIEKLRKTCYTEIDYRNWKNGEQMARRADGGIRLRPVGTHKRRQTAPTYSPAGTGRPAFAPAVENTYKGQNEEALWTPTGPPN